MTERHVCTKETELGSMKADIKVLCRDSSEHQRKLLKLEQRYEDMSTMSTAISVMSVSLEHIVEHNHKQDELMLGQHNTLEKINQNLNRLNDGQSKLDSKVEGLEIRVSKNEELNQIDIREINKQYQSNVLQRYGLPAGIGATAAILISEIIKALF